MAVPAAAVMQSAVPTTSMSTPPEELYRAIWKRPSEIEFVSTRAVKSTCSRSPAKRPVGMKAAPPPVTVVSEGPATAYVTDWLEVLPAGSAAVTVKVFIPTEVVSIGLPLGTEPVQLATAESGSVQL